MVCIFWVWRSYMFAAYSVVLVEIFSPNFPCLIVLPAVYHHRESTVIHSPSGVLDELFSLYNSIISGYSGTIVITISCVLYLVFDFYMLEAVWVYHSDKIIWVILFDYLELVSWYSLFQKSNEWNEILFFYWNFCTLWTKPF